MGALSLSEIRQNISALPGWRTNRKLVVFESDDWGSLRMPSAEVYNTIQHSGIDLVSDEGAMFNKYDTLATSGDISALFDVLSSVKDSTGRSAVFTPVSVVANPDFDRIRRSGFTEYYYEPFTETLNRYKGCENAFALWQEGISRKMFVPQFHGREHLNVRVWMHALRIGNRIARTGFDNCFWGMTTQNEPDIGIEFQAAFDFKDPADLSYQGEVLTSGLDLFREIFGYKASYFVPPNGPFSSQLETLLSEKEVRYLSMPRLQSEPIGYGKTKKKIHWIGKKTRTGLIIITRNCFFEPVNNYLDWVDKCLADISVAFRWYKPAVISSHRVNFTGGLSPDNARNGLARLKDLLCRIIQKWPDVEFVTSEELGDIIHYDQNN
ncbi:polysaccharide (de)acetylase [bacterium]|nr:polysaccharide (de)acetylase [bacterium]